MQNWLDNFYPERLDIVAELQGIAAELNGELKPPQLRWKYAWIRPVLGWKTAKWAQTTLPQCKASILRAWDQTMYQLETRKPLDRQELEGLR
jgi:hypothetical protein